jgi:hypothetical protein
MRTILITADPEIAVPPAIHGGIDHIVDSAREATVCRPRGRLSLGAPPARCYSPPRALRQPSGRPEMARYPHFKVWLDGKIVNPEDAKLSVFTLTVLRGANVHEGLRAYWNPAKRDRYVWKLDEHLKRLNHRMKVMRMQLPYSRPGAAWRAESSSCTKDQKPVR